MDREAMKHTPGPWYIDPIKAHANGNRRIMAEQCTPVAVVPEHLAADARLIAAAPDMLAALVDLLAACPETYDTRHQRLAAMDAITKAHRSL